MINCLPQAQESHGLAPWQAEPYRLWSLLEMATKINVRAFATVVTRLEQARAVAFVHRELQGKEFIQGRNQLGLDLGEFIRQVEPLPLTKAFKAKANRLWDRTKNDKTSSNDFFLLVSELQADFSHEIGEHLFLFVPSSHKDIYEQPEVWFGERVVEKFPDSARDVREACRCFALNRNTASVFHSMGVLEHGLRALAARVNVPIPTEFENWHNIIQQIEKRLREMKDEPKDQRDDREIQFCSSATSHFFAVKEAWRNHVSHGRGNYDEQDAAKILENVRDFMKVLAAWTATDAVNTDPINQITAQIALPRAHVSGEETQGIRIPSNRRKPQPADLSANGKSVLDWPQWYALLWEFKRTCWNQNDR